MISEHAFAVLIEDMPGAGLGAGDVGAVIPVHTQDTAYEVEFMALDGHARQTIQILQAWQNREAGGVGIPHAREPMVVWKGVDARLRENSDDANLVSLSPKSLAKNRAEGCSCRARALRIRSYPADIFAVSGRLHATFLR
jgi:hypothetical protein